MYIKTNALVLREVPYKESSRILTVLTAEHGKLTVNARGAKRKGSKIAASVEPLSYSEMTLFAERGRYTLTEARAIELFEGLTDELELFSLGAYFAEALEAVSDEDMPSPELLSLGLNALYALSRKRAPQELVKAAFELRLAALSGFEPLLGHCSVCMRPDPVAPVFDVAGGVLSCRDCAGEITGEIFRPSAGTLEAMRHIINADPKKIYSFTVGENTLRQLGRICESYLTTQLGTRFAALDYYKKIRQVN